MKNSTIHSIITIGFVCLILYLIVRLFINLLPYALIIIACIWIYKMVKKFLLNKEEKEVEIEINENIYDDNKEDNDNSNVIDVDYKDV